MQQHEVNIIAKMIDHSLLNPALTDIEIINGLREALEYKVASACVKPYSIEIAKKILEGSGVAVCAVIAFPHGNSTTEVKVAETLDAVNRGATEIDMVINIGKALSSQWDYVEKEIAFCNMACQQNAAILKVIFETDFLNEECIIKLCEICSRVKPAYVKTSTGYGFLKQSGGGYDYIGATEHNVELMRKLCPSEVKIKASGGIRTLDKLLKFKELGAARIGASATKSIIEEAKKSFN